MAKKKKEHILFEFIGLGNMGNPIASSLRKAGHDITVYDMRRQPRNFEEPEAYDLRAPKQFQVNLR